MHQTVAQNRDVYESVSYRNTYSSLENRIPDVCRMTVGELLRYATEKCLSGRNMEELYDEDSIKLGYKIIKALLVDLFQSYAHSNQSSYETVKEKLRKATGAPNDMMKEKIKEDEISMLCQIF